MPRANSVKRTALQRRDPFKKGFDKLKALAATVGEADSIVVQEASKALVKGIRSVLRGRGPSTPGAPPRRRRGKLLRSIGRETVAGTMRVGSGHFTADWLQHGLLVPPRPAKSGGMTKGRVIEPRPFMQRGLEAAKAEMTGATVSALRKKTKELAT